MFPKQRGLTLLELLITLALAAVIVSIGLPSLTLSIQNARTTSQVNEMNAFLSLARSEALKLGVDVLVVPGTGDWTGEWVLGVDANSDNDVTGNEILHRFSGLPSTTIAVVDDDGSAVTGIGFQPNGWLLNGPRRDPVPLELTLQAEGCKGNNRRVLRVERGGGLGIVREACV